MHDFREGDRVRVDNCSQHHGRHAIILEQPLESEEVEIAFDDETTTQLPAADLRPVPNVRVELTDREHDTVTNIWGDTSRDLKRLDTEFLWELEHEVAEAVRQSYRDDDMEALGILLGLELKVTQVLSERMED